MKEVVVLFPDLPTLDRCVKCIGLGNFFWSTQLNDQEDMVEG